LFVLPAKVKRGIKEVNPEADVPETSAAEDTPDEEAGND
jgi:hypothetical protein